MLWGNFLWRCLPAAMAWRGASGQQKGRLGKLGCQTQKLWPDLSVLFLGKILKRWQSSKVLARASGQSSDVVWGNRRRCGGFSCGWGQSGKRYPASPSGFPLLRVHIEHPPPTTVIRTHCIMERREHTAQRKSFKTLVFLVYSGVKRITLMFPKRVLSLLGCSRTMGYC